ncbi:MAG: glycosyltransferase [Candidatus Rokuibacteriota bacterium]
MTGVRPDVSLIVPAYNEAERLPGRLRALGEFVATRSWRLEVLVVDDGSADRTAAAAAAESTAALKVRVVSLGVNRGKGAAVKRGVAEAGGGCVAFVDADHPYAFDAFDLALDRLSGGADVVIGGRDLPGSRVPDDYDRMRALSTRVYSVVANRLAVRGIPDTQCGFKWFRAAVAKPLFERVTLTGFAFDVELLALAQRWALRIDRIPVELTHFHGSKVRLARDAPRMFWDLLTINRRLSHGLYDRPH